MSITRAALGGDEYADVLQAASALGIVGGGIFDAMLVHCALKAKVEAKILRSLRSRL